MVFLLFIPLLPVYAQQSTMNKSEQYDLVDVPANAFNVVRDDATVFRLAHEHATNWELEIQNKLVYENPNGSAVIRLYEDLTQQKYIEIGMGSPPDHRFWVAVNTPQDGYFLIHDEKTSGWVPGQVVTVTHSSNSGLSVSAGPDVKVDSLDIAGFTVRAFTVYGMDSTTDPPAVNSGNVTLSFVSGNPAANPIFYMPTILLVGTAALIIVLMKTKKRT
ncbi:MAG: hypothetical protein ACREAN_04885 [Nitrosopumilaceae archaeon]